MYRKFKPLNIPEGWEQYWSKYPNGYTIMEALIDWVSQVDDMVDNINSWNEYLDNFVATFDKELQQTVTDTLSDWQTSGFLDVVISEALQWELDNYIATNEQDKLSLTAQLAEKGAGLASVLTYGADPTGVADSTQAFKDAIAYVRNHLIANSFADALMVLIPGGIYNISDQLIISPFVHLKTQGFVVINSSVSNKSTFIFTAQGGDPLFNSVMYKYQFTRSPLINGNDGGMLVKSILDKTTSASVAIEIGSQTDLGQHYPTCKYSVCDVAIGNFSVALKMNTYNNYIASFNNLHIEDNVTCVKFGDATHTSVANSGENFSFYSCLFAGATTVFDWFCDGMTVNMYGCSADFNGTLFKFRRGYKKVGVWGGHIEACDLIADARLSADTLSPPTLYMGSPEVLCHLNPLFVGAIHLMCDNVKWDRLLTTINSFLYMCDNNVLAQEKYHVVQGGYDIALSPKLNRIRNSKFQNATVNTAPQYPEYTIAWGNIESVSVVDVIPTGSAYTRALKMVSNADAGNYMTIETSSYDVKAGEKIQMGGVVYYTGTTFKNIAFKVGFYDKLGTLITTSADYANKVGAVTNKWQTIFAAPFITAPAGTVTAKMTCTISGLLNGDSAYVGELFLGVS